MLLAGRIWLCRGKNFWLGEIPSLALSVEGDSYDYVREELVSALTELVVGFSFTLLSGEAGGILVETSDIAKTTALILKRNRLSAGMTALEAARCGGSEHTNSVLAYESGSRKPSLTKLDQSLRIYKKRLLVTVI